MEALGWAVSNEACFSSEDGEDLLIPAIMKCMRWMGVGRWERGNRGGRGQPAKISLPSTTTNTRSKDDWKNDSSKERTTS